MNGCLTISITSLWFPSGESVEIETNEEYFNGDSSDVILALSRVTQVKWHCSSEEDYYTSPLSKNEKTRVAEIMMDILNNANFHAFVLSSHE